MGVPLAEPSDPAIPTPRRWILSMRKEEVDQLLERAGLAGGDSADVLIPGE